MWTTDWLNRGTMIPYGSPAEPVPIRRSYALIAGAAAAALAFIVLLGPSVHFVH
jgi:hypothetical protein